MELSVKMSLLFKWILTYISFFLAQFWLPGSGSILLRSGSRSSLKLCGSITDLLLGNALPRHARSDAEHLQHDADPAEGQDEGKKSSASKGE